MNLLLGSYLISLLSRDLKRKKSKNSGKPILNYSKKNKK
tara:strand:- start:677 stop:793 length:117 start_codon:yes stop_codon:yes gene_type:complete